jgi:acetyl-CoA carboxylase biotin carboxyl carrier protein
MWKLPEQDLEALISQFERSQWRELVLRMEGIELVLAKDAEPTYRSVPILANPDTAPSGAAAAPALTQSVAPPKRQPAEVPAGWKQVRAPSLGTFYRALKPGAPPYVEVGSTLTADTEVGMIEVMKLFTTMRAGIAGTVREIYVNDGDLVEFDQPLFLVEPNV